MLETKKNGTKIAEARKNKRISQAELIDCKVDKLTYAFLKNNGANLTGVMPIAD